MSLEKKERTLLIKLFYQQRQWLFYFTAWISTLGEKRPVSRQALRKNITKFEKTGKLSVMPSSGKKWISNEIIAEVSLAVLERVWFPIFFVKCSSDVTWLVSPVEHNAKDRDIKCNAAFTQDSPWARISNLSDSRWQNSGSGAYCDLVSHILLHI